MSGHAAPFFAIPDIAKRLSHPFVYPGGPAAVVGAASSKRQRLSEFQAEAEAALANLTSNVEEGLAEQGVFTANPEQLSAFDASDLRVPLLTKAQAPPSAQLQHHHQLHSWTEAAAWRGGVATAAPIQVKPGRGVSGAAAANGPPVAPASGAAEGNALAAGHDVVLTLTVFEAGPESSRTVMQEIQVLGSNSLAQLRDIISCPTDSLADGMGTNNPAAYFFLDNTFYDDTRRAPLAECSLVLQRWAAAVGLSRPRALYDATQDGDAPEHGHRPPLPSMQQQTAAAGQRVLGGDAAQQQEPSKERPQASQQQQQDHLQQQHCQQEEQQQQHAPSRPPDGSGSGSSNSRGPPMQEMRIGDLLLQVSNRPTGLFSHQGCCEHAIMVSDTRLLHATDPDSRSEFPRTIYRAPLYRRLACTVCKKLGALLLLLKHPETPEEVSVLCSSCAVLFDTQRYPESTKIVLGELM